MPTTLSTTVRHIYDRVPNSVNSKLTEDFHSYMKSNDASERHQNNNLKAIIAYAESIGYETTFYQISAKEQVIKFLDKKIKSNSNDPEHRWITTWNDCQAGNGDDDDDYNHNATLIKTKQTKIFSIIELK